MGPMAGLHGGEVVFSGTHAELIKSDSLTARYLTGRERPRNQAVAKLCAIS